LEKLRRKKTEEEARLRREYKVKVHYGGSPKKTWKVNKGLLKLQVKRGI